MKTDFNYPETWLKCKLDKTELTSESKWEVCCGCRHFDQCDLKEMFRMYSGCGLILLFVAVVVTFIVWGVL